MILVVSILGAENEAVAFHAGGVGPCDSCHSMHNSVEGQPVIKDLTRGTHANLLIAQDTSSTCLNCHQQAGDAGPTTYHVSTPALEMPAGVPPKQLTPAGDFGWLNKTYSWLVSAMVPTAYYSYGERHGHNIVAADFLYDPDSTYTIAPGGFYPADQLACTSCHDPHGRYRRTADGSIATTGTPISASGSFASSPAPDARTSVGAYRMLGGKGYQPKSLIGNFGFVNDPPAAVAPNWPNRSEDTTQTRVAYGSGMSEWCQNCHANIHTSIYPGPSNLIHAAGNAAKLGQHYADNYNSYIKTGVTTTPDASSSYLSLVPFEEGTADYTVLKAHAKTDDTWLAGPDNMSSQVMCLSCHRAHASGWDGMTRWNTVTDYIVYNGQYAQEGQPYQPYGQGRTEIEATRAYYNRPASKFALNQDTLCNKCHIGVYP